MIELCCELLSVWCTWLNVLVTSCMHFRVNPLYIFLNVEETLAGNRCEWLCCVVSTYLFRTFACMFLSSHVRISEWIYPLYLTEYSRNKRDIWSLSYWKETQTHSQLIRKPALSHLAKIANWLSCVVSNYLYGTFDWMFLSCHVHISEWIHTLYFPECQGTLSTKQVQYLKFKWLPRDSNSKPLSSLSNTQLFGQNGQLIELLWKIFCTVLLTECSCHVK